MIQAPLALKISWRRSLANNEWCEISWTSFTPINVILCIDNSSPEFGVSIENFTKIFCSVWGWAFCESDGIFGARRIEIFVTPMCLVTELSILISFTPKTWPAVFARFSTWRVPSIPHDEKQLIGGCLPPAYENLIPSQIPKVAWNLKLVYWYARWLLHSTLY